MSHNSCPPHPTTKAPELVWKAIEDGEAFITPSGGTTRELASGQKVTMFVDMERVFQKPGPRGTLLGLSARHPCIREAEALSFVPNGMRDFTIRLGEVMTKKVVMLARDKGAPRDEMYVPTDQDKELLRSVKVLRLLEDVSTTGGSAYAAAQTLWEINPDLEIHTVSFLQRSPVNPQYQTGPNPLVYHTFNDTFIPHEVEEFRRQFPNTPVHAVKMETA